MTGAWSAPFEETGAPAVDLKETEKELVLVATVPGVEKDQLKVNIQEDSVTIEGERREEKEAKGENYHWQETAYGSFRRVVPLPAAVLADKAKAKLKDGVLTLSLPKAAPSKRKQIEIKVE